MADTYLDIPYAPIGGVNGTDSEDNIGETEIADARNMICEQKQIFNRPSAYLTTPGFTSTSRSILFAKGFEADLFGYFVFIDSLGRIGIHYAGGTVETFTSGVTTNFYLEQYHNATIVNGALLIGNNLDGIMRLATPFNSALPAAMPTAKYRYVVGHYSRAFAAYDTSGTGPNARQLDNPIKVGWSVPGDESTWTAPPNTVNGSGSAVLSDAPDVITGLAALRNVVVIFRQTGIHLGYANNSNSPAYNFQVWTRDTVGLSHPSSLATANDLCFYIGQDDVKVFDLNQVTSIGYKIRRILQPYIDEGVAILGFCTTDDYNPVNIRDKLRYHIIPLPTYGKVMSLNGGPSSLPTIHFIYSVEDGNWSIHDYAFTPTAAVNFIGDPVTAGNTWSATGPTLFVDSGNANLPALTYVWNDSSPCERPSYFVGKQFIVEKPEKDYMLQRLLLRSRDYGVNPITATVTSRLNNTANSQSKIVNCGANNDSYYVRNWFDLLGDGTQVGTGQDFQARIDVPANQRFSANYVGMRLTEAGDFRG